MGSPKSELVALGPPLPGMTLPGVFGAILCGLKCSQACTCHLNEAVQRGPVGEWSLGGAVCPP